MIPGVRKEIEDYICSEIVPRYAEFDPAHREDHAVAVIDNSMKLYREAPAELRSGITTSGGFTGRRITISIPGRLSAPM